MPGDMEGYVGGGTASAELAVQGAGTRGARAGVCGDGNVEGVVCVGALGTHGDAANSAAHAAAAGVGGVRHVVLDCSEIA